MIKNKKYTRTINNRKNDTWICRHWSNGNCLDPWWDVLERSRNQIWTTWLHGYFDYSFSTADIWTKSDFLRLNHTTNQKQQLQCFFFPDKLRYTWSWIMLFRTREIFAFLHSVHWDQFLWNGLVQFNREPILMLYKLKTDIVIKKSNGWNLKDIRPQRWEKYKDTCKTKCNAKPGHWVP